MNAHWKSIGTQGQGIELPSVNDPHTHTVNTMVSVGLRSDCSNLNTDFDVLKN